MPDFMSHQEIVDRVACTLPHRKRQHTLVDIKLSGGNFTVLNNQILSSKEFGELRFDFLLNWHGSPFDVHIILNPHLSVRALSDSL